MNELISVIIPVYNSKKYIGDCLESVLKQTYKNIEIIVVDDGSTDGSGEICEEFLKKDNRIKVYHISNSGVAKARNIGIINSKGKFIVFSDSDDLYETYFLERTIKLMGDVEYFSGAFLTVSEKNKEKLIDYLDKEEESISIEKYLERMLNYQAGAYWGANWGKIYRSDIIKKYNIKFESKVNFAEDFRFNLEYLRYVRKIAISHYPVYRYKVDTIESLSKKRKDSIIYWKEYLELFKRYKILFEEHKLFSKYDLKIYEFLVRASVIVTRDGIYCDDLNIKKAKILIKEILKDLESYKIMEHISELNKSERMSLSMLKNSGTFFAMLFYVKKYLKKLC